MAVTDPRYWFVDEGRLWQHGLPLWWRQERDYTQAIRVQYREWFAQLLQARSMLEDLEREVVGIGPAARWEIEAEVAREPAFSQDRRRVAAAWAAVGRGLERCRTELVRRGEPADIGAYWRPRVSSVAARLAALDRAMVGHEDGVAVCVDRPTYREMRTLRDAADAMVSRADARVAAAIDGVRMLDESRGALPVDEEGARALERHYRLLAASCCGPPPSPREAASSIDAIARGLGITVVLPIATWPAPRLCLTDR